MKKNFSKYLIRGVVLLWAGRAWAPPVFGSEYSKSRVGPLHFFRLKGPKMMLAAWTPLPLNDAYAPRILYLYGKYLPLEIVGNVNRFVWM